MMSPPEVCECQWILYYDSGKRPINILIFTKDEITKSDVNSSLSETNLKNIVM